MNSAAAEALVRQEDAFGAHNYNPLEAVFARGEGVYLYDVDGKRYLDFLAAYSAVNQGHNHPKIVAAMVEQSHRLSLTSRAFRNDRYPPLLEKLCGLTGFDRALLMNSGAEAVETSIKAARKWAYEVKGVEYPKAEIIVADGNFHGRTTTIVGFSSDPVTTGGFGPFTPGFKSVPFGDLQAVADAITPNTAAILLEPIQGEAGVIIPPKGFLAGLRSLADESNCLLMFDEIQSGLGRTGKLFAFEHEGIRPDAVMIGKALSGGCYPVSAFLASREVMGFFTPGTHGSTYGGNPLACAVADAALDVLVEERLIERSAEMGEYFGAKVRSLSSPVIEEIRTIGMWAALQFKTDASPARDYCNALMERGVLCKDTHVTVIRLAPPLVITKDQIDFGVDQISAVLPA